MKHKRYRADLKDWQLDAVDEFDYETVRAAATAMKEALRSLEKLDKLRDVALTAAGEALQYVFEDDETYLYFPIGHSTLPNPTDGAGGEPVTDPLTMYLRVGMESHGEKPTFEFSLSDVINEFIADMKDGGDTIEGVRAAPARAMAGALREMVERLESAISPEDQE